MADPEIVYTVKVDDKQLQQELKQVDKAVSQTTKAAADKVDKASKDAAKSVASATKSATQSIDSAGEACTDFSQKLAEISGQSLDDVNAAIQKSNDEFQQILASLQKAPKNADLAKQGVTVLGEAAAETRKKVALLVSTQEAMKKALDSGELSADAYRAYEREVSDASASLKTLQKQAKLSEKDIRNLAQGVEVSLSKWDGFKAGVGKAAKATGAAFASMGSAAVSIGTKAISGAVEFDKAMNKFAASTGTAEGELSAYEETLKAIYAGNYGESYEDIANAMTQVTHQMGDLDQTSLQHITESAFLLRDTFGYDVAESARAASTLMNQFGIDGDKAMALIAAGAQNGLDASGDLLGNIDSYAAQFAQAGLSADDMFKLLQKGAEDGTLQMDEISAAVGELGPAAVEALGGIEEGAYASGDALASLKTVNSDVGSTLEGMKRQAESVLLDLGNTLLPIITQLLETVGPMLSGLFDSLQPALETAMGLLTPLLDSLLPMLTTAFGQLMEPIGTLAETLLPVLTEAWGTISEPLGNLVEVLLPPLTELLTLGAQTLGELGATILPVLAEMVAIFIETITPIVEELLPILLEVVRQLLDPLMQLMDAIMPVLLELFKAIIEPVAALAMDLMPILKDILDALMPAIDAVIGVVGPLVELFAALATKLVDQVMPVIRVLASVFGVLLANAIEQVAPILETLMNLLSGIITFITGVFTGDWEKAWDGIVGIFRGIFNIIPSIIEGALNGGITLINGIIRGINKVTGIIGIPEIPLIPKVELPRFHAGGIVDFRVGEGLALLRDGEMVLTQAQQAKLFALANGAAGGGAQPIVITSPVYLDGREISRSVTQHQYTDVMARRYK